MTFFKRSSSASSDDDDDSSSSSSDDNDTENEEEEEMSTNNVEFSKNQTSPKDETAGSDGCPFRSLRNFASKESDDEQVRKIFVTNFFACNCNKKNPSDIVVS